MIAPEVGPDGAPVLIVRKSADHYLALSMQCTHMGCPVDPPVHAVMTCPCHGSQFDLTGQVRHGPAQYPLGQYEATYDQTTKTLRITLG
jgi:Rieske Fe-S protein